ncbi:MAG: hypothetical protein C0453_18855, partial [Comamonadaceae bacterium]|nr:hypothetical protein [Comamonadaceae bacterium]
RLTERPLPVDPVDLQGTGASGGAEAPETEASQTDWIDAERWEAFAEFDDSVGSLRREIVGEFLSSLGGRIAEISRAVAAEDAQALRQATHVLKGSAGNVGAQGLARACEDLERLTDQPERARALLTALEHAAQATVQALKAL